MKNFYHTLLITLLAPMLLLGACHKDDEKKPLPQLPAVGTPSFEISKQSNGYVLPIDPESPHQIDSGSIITFENTSSGTLRTASTSWTIEWVDSKGVSQQRVVKAYKGKAFMRFIDFDTTYSIAMTIGSKRVTYNDFIEVMEAANTDDPNQPGGDTGGVDTVEDTFLADAGWDTSFENASLGNWKNFGWGKQFDMNTISQSNMMAHTGTYSTYFEIEANGGMAGGFRDATGTQLTIPVVAGNDYEVGFWIFITAKPAAPNLCVVFGGNGSGYIPVDLSAAEVGKWCYTRTKITATLSDVKDLLLFVEHSAVAEPFNFYVDDIAMDDYTEE